MESSPQEQREQPPHGLHSLLHSQLPTSSLPLRSTTSTPLSSPGLYTPSASRYNLSALPPASVSSSSTPAPTLASPFLHPLQTHRVRETHKALIDSDNINGRKSINQYEVIEEIGRGMHGKVKLARNLESGENVAIKIIPRFSKKRRLGKVTAKSPQDKTKKEIAILKKIRHPNVVALLEVIDDPELKKIYMILEHAELGEIVWRKKGLPHVCQYERRRVERETSGDLPTSEERQYDQMLERRQAVKEIKRAKMAQQYAGPSDYWSVEHGAADDFSSSLGGWSRSSARDNFAFDGASSEPGSRRSSVFISRSQSAVSGMDGPSELDEAIDWEDDMETPGLRQGEPVSTMGLDGTMYGPYDDENSGPSHSFRGRSPSMADSIISHMSSVDYNPRAHDSFADDFSYVPCFTFDQARSAFRDTVLGLEYLHYQGVVHRDIKPANLLWSKNHRVKISDFGVSYFGRPIREGEPDDLVSESEARDFDDDLELAKTVGTPAFFAPELCYTDIAAEQPKVSEQIDVWSLGVTLYCLIYARIPFLAEDEFQMFRKIANEEVHISRRRLRPVDPSTSPSTQSLYKRQNVYPYRHDNDVGYEDVDNLLYDLLRRMLTKNPEKRIRLRDIKRHPWVVKDINNVVGWLDDTDPAGPSFGRKIQVDEREMSSAVVPLTFLERARSVVKKAVGKVIHPLAERSDSRSRKRATSSAASSTGDSMLRNFPTTPQYRGERRSSLRQDDFFANAARDASVSTDHLSSSKMTAVPAPETINYDPLATILSPADQWRSYGSSKLNDHVRDGRHSASPRSFHRHGYSHGKLGPQFLSLSPVFPISQTTPATPACHEPAGGQEPVHGILKMTDEPQSFQEDIARSYSVDRGLFASTDKRAPAQVALTAAVAPGQNHGPRHTTPIRSIDLGKAKYGYNTPSPLSSSPQSIAAMRYLHSRSQSNTSLINAQLSYADDVPEEKQEQGGEMVESMASRGVLSASPDSYEGGEPNSQPTRTSAQTDDEHVDPANIPCPPSPGKTEWTQKPTAVREDTGTTAMSSRADSIEVPGTPLTNLSETTSPIEPNLPAMTPSEKILAFQSDPSLPALLSGASSVSADLEGELLGKPGVVSTAAPVLGCSDSLTPPTMDKAAPGGFPLEQVFENPPAMESGTLNLQLQTGRPRTPDNGRPQQSHNAGVRHIDEDDDDSEDEVLVMAKTKRRSHSKPVSPSAATIAHINNTNLIRTPRLQAKRRDTNISTASNETAKKVPIDDDATPVV